MSRTATTRHLRIGPCAAAWASGSLRGAGVRRRRRCVAWRAWRLCARPSAAPLHGGGARVASRDMEGGMCLSGAMGLESAACACCEQTRTPQRASSAPRVVHTHPRPQPQPSPRAPSPPLPLPLTAAGAPPSSAPCNAQTPRCVRLCASRSPSWAASSQVGVTWVVTRAGAGAGAGTGAPRVLCCVCVCARARRSADAQPCRQAACAALLLA